MNYFIEGLQGSGKSVLVRKLSELHPECAALHEGDYSPIELAWCAYTDEEQYREILDKYPDLRDNIIKNTFAEGDKRIICYTKIRTENRSFYSELEGYEIYNGRVSFDDFKSVVLSRLKAFDGDNMIFECSLFQNIVEEMILFRCASDDEIIGLYKKIRDALDRRNYHIVYLKTVDFRGNLDVIRKERSDDKGNELWFPAMLGFFNDSPYAKRFGLSGENDLIEHFRHRQELELRICEEIFSGRYTLLSSKAYTEKELSIHNRKEDH